MSLWVDKHRPRDLAKLDFHKKQAKQLKNLATHGDFPHLMFYGRIQLFFLRWFISFLTNFLSSFSGPSGSGKKTRIMCLLRELYGAGVERLKSESMQFTTPSNKKIDILTVGR